MQIQDDEHYGIREHWVTKSVALAVLVAWLIFLASPALSQPPTRSELEWSAELAQSVNGETEYRLPDGSRVDILTDTEAIEVEWSNKWPESIGQASFYALATDRKPCVWLLLRADSDEDYLRCLMVCRRLNIRLRTTRAH